MPRVIAVAPRAASLLLLVLLASSRPGTPGAERTSGGAAVALDPARMARVSAVDERYSSYNVEMLEVTGGRFWRPYGPELEAALHAPAAPAAGGDTPAGMNPGLYQYRPPIDLANPRLRRLAAALGPAYVRVSGTWANTTFFPATDETPAKPPPGFSGILTHAQWKGVVDFAKAAGAELVTSFAISAGTRDGSGAWTPAQARRLAAYTRSVGGRIAAAEFFNEPNLAAMGGAPPGYDAAAYGRDFRAFRAFARKTLPGMTLLGPGSVGETSGAHGLAYGTARTLATRDLLAASGPGVDAVSYHHYGAVSRRCAAMDHQTTPEAALSEDWLGRTDETLAFYRQLRDRFEPGKPFWVTETADAACGGNPWAATFLDTFRYLDQLGRLARQDVRVVMHNTLVASDYGLLDEETFAPKAMYWGALLWRRLMGTTVLESGVPIQPGLHVYAHCLRGERGGVAVLVLNTDRAAARSLAVPAASERFVLTSGELASRSVQLNGRELALGPGDALPELAGVPTPAGEVTFAPASITFLAVRGVANGACVRAP